MAGRPLRRAQRAEIFDKVAREAPGRLPDNWDELSNTAKLEHSLKCSLTGVAILMSCNPLELLPIQMGAWNEARRQLWDIALQVHESSADRIALVEALERGFEGVGAGVAEAKAKQKALAKPEDKK